MSQFVLQRLTAHKGPEKEKLRKSVKDLLKLILDPSGVSHTRMCTTRAKFKLTLRYCRRHVDQMKADVRAKGLLEANGNSKFWKGISRDVQ